MQDDLLQRLKAMPNAKRIAVAIYGESVAAYRYGVLADSAVSAEHQHLFLSMKAEEEGHRAALKRLAAKQFPGADFVLNAEDKELVISGTRMLAITDSESFLRAMKFLHDTERRTGEFYRVLHDLIPDGDLGPFLAEMADECVEHAKSLLELRPS
jgi:rubrerythrin